MKQSKFFICMLFIKIDEFFQTAYFQHRDGLLPDDLWRRHRAVGRWWLTKPGIQSAMKLIGPTFDPDFVAEITPRRSASSNDSEPAA